MRNLDKKLKYEKFNGTNNIIVIDLHNFYEIIAIIGKDKENNYDVQLMLKQGTVDTWELIEEAEHLIFNKTVDNIYSAILKKIGIYLHEGFFTKYIDRYEKELEYYEIGLEKEESEKFGEESYKVEKSQNGYRTVYYCPECGGDLGDTDTERYTFCPRCRVLLDWSDID